MNSTNTLQELSSSIQKAKATMDGSAATIDEVSRQLRVIKEHYEAGTAKGDKMIEEAIADVDILTIETIKEIVP